MKKIFATLLISVLCILAYSACGFIIGEKQALAAPDLQLAEDGSYVFWDAVPHAVYYEVIIGGDTIAVRDGAVEYHFTAGGGDITVTVQAIGDGILYDDSEVSEISGDFYVKLDTPEVTLSREAEDLVIDWPLVPGAIGYIVSVNGTAQPALSESLHSYTYDMGVVFGDYEVTVTALGAEANYLLDSTPGEAAYNYVLPIPAALHSGELADKSYDKAGGGTVSFQIDFNDDTMYSLTGSGVASSDYIYSDDLLTINEAFLMALSIGEHDFTFTTEQSDIDLTVDVSDTRGPQLTSSGTNFNLETADNDDVVIGFVLNGYTLDAVKLDGTALTAGADYTLDASSITIAADDIEGWPVGEYDIELDLSLDTETAELHYTITVINTTLPYSVQNSVVYDKASSVDAAFDIFLNEYEFDTLQGPLTSDDYSFDGGDSELAISGDYLYGLELGDYYFTVYTKDGIYPVNAFPVCVQVINTSTQCYNVRIDLDSDYPSVVLKWDCDAGASDYSYKINDVSQPIVTGVKQIVLTGVTKNTEFTYTVRPVIAGGAWSPEQTYTPETAGISYLSHYYTFMGETHDYYIDSQEDMNDYIYYGCFDRSAANLTDPYIPDTAIENEYGYLDMDEVYIGFDYGTNIGGGDGCNELNLALASVPLKGSFSVLSSIWPDNHVAFTIVYRSAEAPSLDKVSENTAVQEDYMPSDIEDLKGTAVRNGAYEGFAINSITKTQAVSTSEQLFNVVHAGLKPIPATGSKAEDIYEEAKDILRDIITDDMSDVDKVHAIYDWLIINVQYDQAVLEIYGNPSDPEYGSLNDFDCFYLEGSILDHVAVCDGFSKAFVLLARMEGIEAIKVSGVSRGVNHAWNKVNIGGNWYVVDCTWGNVTSGSSEYLSHAYLLVSDADLVDSHRENEGEAYPAAPNSYEYFKTIKYDATEDYYIESRAEMVDLINTIVINESVTYYIEVYNNTEYDSASLLSNSSLPYYLNTYSHYYFSIGKTILIKYN